MTCLFYDIVMQTEIGPKKGTADFRIDESIISGNFRLFGQLQPFTGVMSDAGVCCLCGRLKTLMQEIGYTATGYIDTCKLDLVLRGDRWVFHITGRACTEGAFIKA